MTCDPKPAGERHALSVAVFLVWTAMQLHARCTHAGAGVWQKGKFITHVAALWRSLSSTWPGWRPLSPTCAPSSQWRLIRRVQPRVQWTSAWPQRALPAWGLWRACQSASRFACHRRLKVSFAGLQKHICMREGAWNLHNTPTGTCEAVLEYNLSNIDRVSLKIPSRYCYVSSLQHRSAAGGKQVMHT